MGTRGGLACMSGILLCLGVGPGGCVSAPRSVSERMLERAENAPRVIEDPARAAEAKTALEGMHTAAAAIEESVHKARADVLSLHHDPAATPEDFRRAIEGMRERNRPFLERLLALRIEAAAATTRGEWDILLKD